jgi:hypothetical protein
MASSARSQAGLPNMSSCFFRPIGASYGHQVSGMAIVRLEGGDKRYLFDLRCGLRPEGKVVNSLHGGVA